MAGERNQEHNDGILHQIEYWKCCDTNVLKLVDQIKLFEVCFLIRDWFAACRCILLRLRPLFYCDAWIVDLVVHFCLLKSGQRCIEQMEFNKNVLRILKLTKCEVICSGFITYFNYIFNAEKVYLRIINKMLIFS